MAFLLWVLLLVVIIGLPIYLVVMVGDLRARVTNLETWAKKVHVAKADENDEKKPMESPAEIVKAEVIKETKVHSKEKEIKSMQPERTSFKKEKFSFEQFLGKSFFSVLGTVSIVVALVFFSVWAIEKNLIGPVGRLMIGGGVSLLFLAVGEFLETKKNKFSQYLSAVGVAGLMVVNFVARYVYGFVTPMPFFWFQVMVIALGLFLCLRYSGRVLANFVVVGGLLTPFLMEADLLSGPGSFVGQAMSVLSIELMVYLVLLSLAAVVISMYKKWSEITVILLFGVWFFEVMLFGGSIVNSHMWLFALLIGAVHYLISSGVVVRFLRNRQPLKIASADDMIWVSSAIASIVIGNFLVYRVFVIQQWPHFGLILLVQALLLMGLRYYLQSLRGERDKGLEESLLGIALTAITLVFPIELAGSYHLILTLCWVLESIALALVGRKLDSVIVRWFSRISLLIGAWTFASFHFYDLVFWQNSIAAWAVIIGCGISVLCRRKLKEDNLWSVFVYGLASYILLRWNFVDVAALLEHSSVLPAERECVLYLVPGIWVLLSGYVVRKKEMSKIEGAGAGPLVVLGVLNFIFMTRLFVYGGETSAFAWLNLLLMMVVNFGYLRLSERKKTELVVLSASTMSLLWFVFGVLSEPILTLTLVAWAAILFSLGIARDWEKFRYFGIGIFLLVIAKVYLLNVWMWAVWIRFVVFGLLGVALLLTSYFYSKKR